MLKSAYASDPKRRLAMVDDLIKVIPAGAAGIRHDPALLISNLWVTLEEVALGLAIAVVAGVGSAVLMHMFRPLRDAAYPLLVASQAIPVVVLAPLFVLAFDYGIGPKLAATISAGLGTNHTKEQHEGG